MKLKSKIALFVAGLLAGWALAPRLNSAASLLAEELM